MTPLDCSPPDSSDRFPGKNGGVGCHFLLQGIFPIQGSNPCLLWLLQLQVDSLPLSHLGSLETLQEWEFQQRSGLRARIQEDKQETRVCPPIPPLHLLCNLGQTARPLQGNGEGLDDVSLGQLLIEGPNPAQKIKSSNKWERRKGTKGWSLGGPTLFSSSNGNVCFDSLKLSFDYFVSVCINKVTFWKERKVVEKIKIKYLTV